jgi:hypothetical protein
MSQVKRNNLALILDHEGMMGKVENDFVFSGGDFTYSCDMLVV